MVAEQTSKLSGRKYARYFSTDMTWPIHHRFFSINQMFSDRLDFCTPSQHNLIYLCSRPTPSNSTTMQFILRIALALAAFAQCANALATPSQQAMGVGFGSPVSFVSTHPRKSICYDHCIPRVTRQLISALPSLCPLQPTQSQITSDRFLLTNSKAFVVIPYDCPSWHILRCFANITAISSLYVLP